MLKAVRTGLYLNQLFILIKIHVSEGDSMPNQKNNPQNLVSYSNQVNRLNKEKDTYDILKKATEVDTDVNEDQNRERLLDESVDAFLESNEQEY
jgi:hypothetical protein